MRPVTTFILAAVIRDQVYLKSAWALNISTEPSTTICRKSGRSPSLIKIVCCGKRWRKATLTSDWKFSSLMSLNSGSARMSFQSD